ncbi:hypothetical protein WJX82_009537 [Trebouxia sp. C0006]
MPVKRAAPATTLSGPETPQRVKRSNAATTTHETALDSEQGLVMMVTDIADEAAGVFHIWGNAPDGSSVLLRVHDFQPYFYIAGPLQAGPYANGTIVEADLDEAACTGLMHALNRSMPPDGRIQKLVAMKRRPIMYYRPQAPQGSTFIKVLLAAGMNVKKAAGAVKQALQKDSLRQQGFTWLDLDQYEHEVNALQRFLVDTAVSGGSWIHVPPAAAQAPPAQTLAPTTPIKAGASGHAGSSPAPAPGQVGGCQAVTDQKHRLSNCALEVIAPWRSLQALTPDATQLADPTWRPTPFTPAGAQGGVAPKWQQAADWAKQGRINNLSLMALDVLMAPHDAKDRVAVPGQGDPIIAITCMSHASSQATSKAQPAAPAAELQLEGVTAEDEGLEGVLEGDLEGGSQGAGGASTSESDESGHKLVFMWQARQTEAHFTEAVSGAHVYRYSSEERMLKAWLAHVEQMDPDAFYLYQVKDTLGAIAARFKALHIGGGGLFVGRLLAPHARPLSLKSVVRYSPNWVKNQNRMASTSNQETYRTDVDGRLVFDILRQVLNGVNLASFSLVDCAQTLLGQRLEVVPARCIAAWAGLATPMPKGNSSKAGSNALRLARYAMARGKLLQQLLQRLATVPETVELARATGLTLPQILYNAQMIRTWSLLLRNAQRQGYVVAGRQAGEPLQESPYLMHPVECNTVGLYKTPVAILDFASLYPSLYRAHNLCYSTLLHPDDVTGLPPEHTTEVLRPKANVKSHFVKPELRKGILPSILAALIEARATTRASLKEATDAGSQAILDSRQKALKLTANALYGFTGAMASPLQSTALADGCLALGSQATQHARETLEAVAAQGKLGKAGRGGKIIYAQTDSIFASFPNATTEEAIQVGKLAGQLVSAAFPAVMDLKFERVCQPFMMLHVNRYAGRGYEREEDVGRGGVLLVKGLKSMWRQAAPIVRNTLQGALRRIIMQDDVTAASKYVEGEVRRLLGGSCEAWEMVMTGGLWRLTGQQIAGAAAEGEGGGASSSSKGAAGGGEGADDVRGPHASLAVKLQQRDPGRSFVLGERLQYILLPGLRTQDEAAEDPLTAVLAGQQADFDLYWKNKLLRPLSEMFAVCLNPSQLHNLLSGLHTMVRLDLSTVPTNSGSDPNKRKGARQTGMMNFYKGTIRCLGCKRHIPSGKLPPDAGVEGPGLCDVCSSQEGKWEEVYLEYLQHVNRLEHREAEMLYEALAPADAPSSAPDIAAEPSSELASLSQPLSNSTISTATGSIGGAVDKDAITRGAGVASSNRYGSVIAGTLVAAVVIVGLAGTVLVWRRRAGAYQGLHDTEMAMIRREH